MSIALEDLKEGARFRFKEPIEDYLKCKTFRIYTFLEYDGSIICYPEDPYDSKRYHFMPPFHDIEFLNLKGDRKWT